MASSISIDGMLNDIRHMGFTRGDAEREGIDNALDAGADTVRITRNTVKSAVSISDNGSGMDEAGCVKSLCFFDAVPASNKTGLFGLGNKALHICLSSGMTQTTILSKKTGLPRAQLKADWLNACRTGVWNPTASEIGADTGIHLWNELAINHDHGTIMHIPMPPTEFASHQANLQSDLAELGFSYEEEILSGKRIDVLVDGLIQPLDMSLGLGWDNVGESQRKEQRVELWTRGNEERIYYMHTSLRPTYTAMVHTAGDSTRKIQDYDEAAAQGFTLKRAAVMYSVYNPAWDVHGQPEIPGYLALRRGSRNLCRLQCNIAKTGDLRARRIIASTRHVISFTSEADDVFGVEVNKSHVREESIHPGLLEKFRELGKNWSLNYYNEYVKVAREAAPGESEMALRIRRAVATLKRFAAAHGTAYLDDFDNLTDDYNELENRDDE
jgi:hypothetical protein